MIPVNPQPEPPNFDADVRQPGCAFLATLPSPTGDEWRGRDYWRRVLKYARQVYGGICAYSAQWIPSVTGSDTIDHFLPKSQCPILAYEWSNYRYSSLKLNSRKGHHLILDPFRVQFGWFTLGFPSLLVKPDPGLPHNLQTEIRQAIGILKLNDDEACIESRQSWVLDFCRGEITFAFLQRKAPFIANELQRQGLVCTIRRVMGIV